LLFYMMTIGDSAVIVRFEEIDGSVSAGKPHVDGVLETELHGARLWIGGVGLLPKPPSVD
jgi:hypothetical protein